MRISWWGQGAFDTGRGIGVKRGDMKFEEGGSLRNRWGDNLTQWPARTSKFQEAFTEEGAFRRRGWIKLVGRERGGKFIWVWEVNREISYYLGPVRTFISKRGLKERGRSTKKFREGNWWTIVRRAWTRESLKTTVRIDRGVTGGLGGERGSVEKFAGWKIVGRRSL